MGSSHSQNGGVSRRSVLIGAAALGGALVTSSALAGSGARAVATRPAMPIKDGLERVKVPTRGEKTIKETLQGLPDPVMLGGWQVQPFGLFDVELTGGVFQRARDSLLDFAKEYPVDRMLACFRTNAGIDDKGVEPAGGWENYPKNDRALAKKQQWGPREYKKGQNKDTADGLLRGHYAGHFLSMLAQTYAESKDATILQKTNTMISGLKECRNRLREMTYNGQPRYSHPGFFAAYGEWQFSALEEYAPYGEIWAPWYTEHKILAGLIAVYEQTGNSDALDIAEGIGHWTYSRLSRCTTEQLQKMWDIYIGGEFGGMNESLLDLYNLSADSAKHEFLQASHCFDTDKLIGNCANNIDILNGLHANQHLPQFVGYAKDAAMGEKTTGSGRDADYLATTEGFWKMIVPGRMYAHGGTGQGEMWGPAHTVAGDIGTRNCESCAAYNMLKIARCLFFMNPKAEYMDYYERTVLNHILGGKSRDLDSGADLTPGNCYMYPVNPATIKEYGDGNIGTCCGGTALESHTKLQDSIYFHSSDDTTLYVNLFIPSTLHWKSRGIRLSQVTEYPETGRSVLTVEQAPSQAMTVKVRVPGWSDGATITVNGKEVEAKIKAGSYASVKRIWKDGDTIELFIPLALRTEGTDDRDDIQALFYGPTVLNALNSSTKYIARGFAERLGLDGTIKLGIRKKSGTRNYFIIDGDEFEPAYNGNNDPYHMYFLRRDEFVGFAGKSTNVRNPHKPVQTGEGPTSLMDEIWSAAPFADRKSFIAQVIKSTSSYQKAGLLSSHDRQVILLAAGRAKMS